MEPAVPLELAKASPPWVGTPPSSQLSSVQPRFWPGGTWSLWVLKQSLLISANTLVFGLVALRQALAPAVLELMV